jgi:cytochrome o ubiquinol oxidase operon protein cyoD
MSAHATGHDHAGNDHSGGHHVEGEHGTLRGYLTGFFLAVFLTAIPFWLVMGRPIVNVEVIALAVMAFAMVQIVVHMIYFLHMNTRSEGGWTMLALIFTLVLVAITLSGSMWVMFHLNANMMPLMGHDMRGMP